MAHTARALAGAGYQVNVVCRAHRRAIIDGVQYQDLSDADPPPSEVHVWVRDYWRRRRSGHAWDILWAHDSMAEILSLNRHGSPGLFRERLLSFDAVVFVSEWHRAEVLAACGLTSSELLTAVCLNPLPPLPPPATRSPATLVHTAHPRKALVALLRAWPLIHSARRDLRLLLCGHPDLYQEKLRATDGTVWTLERLAGRYVVEDGSGIVIGPKGLSQRDVLALVAESALLLHPDVSVETGATTVLEAMAVGTVPVVSDAGCLPGLVEGRGCIVPLGPRFIERYAASVLRLLGDVEAMRTFALAGRHYASVLCDPRHTVQNWSALIDDVGRLRSGRAMMRCRPRRSSVWCVSLDDVDAGAWDDAVTGAENAWFSHSRAWYETEKASPDVLQRSFGVVDGVDGKVHAIVPLASVRRAPGIVVSGLFEAAGPWLRSESEFRPDVLDAVVAGMLRSSPRNGIVVLKWSPLSWSGRSAVEPDLADVLRATGFSFGTAELWIAESASRRTSARTQTQIRRSRERCQIARATTEEEVSVVIGCYSRHSEVRGALALSADALGALWKTGKPTTLFFLAKVGDKPIGFAIALRWGRSASLFAWGVDPDALKIYASKQLVREVLDSLFHDGVQDVDLGGAYLTTAPSGLREFHRRLGCKPRTGVVATRRGAVGIGGASYVVR